MLEHGSYSGDPVTKVLLQPLTGGELRAGAGWARGAAAPGAPPWPTGLGTAQRLSPTARDAGAGWVEEAEVLQRDLRPQPWALAAVWCRDKAPRKG